MPMRGWFLTALVEDIEAGVVWGARLACPTSWQIPTSSCPAGLADRELGHWIKTVQPDKSFTTPPAW
jgi:alpha-galactosidase